MSSGTMSFEDRRALEALHFRIRSILPEEYQDSYEEVQPVSMGSAGLKFGTDGRVAWDEMWGSFCDLAMAGGPPHKGMLLEPGTRSDVSAQAERYAEVVEEICRGAFLVTDLSAKASPHPGWIRVECLDDGMADWLVRAIVMENVAARREGEFLDLPAAPGFRLDKEIKNVVTVTAKTCHYWMGHIPRGQQRAITRLFATIAQESPLIEPSQPDDNRRTAACDHLAGRMAERLSTDAGLRVTSHHYAGWLGVECPSVRAAVWIMRALVVVNVLARREGTVLFVPINPESDPTGEIVVKALTKIHGLGLARQVA
jgi:sirohydrochlorin cobaltochelatase